MNTRPRVETFGVCYAPPPAMSRTTSAAVLLAAVAVSGLQVGPGALAHARFSCPAPPRCGAPPLLCTDVAGEDIYGRKTAAEETIDVYGRSSKASDFSDMMSDPVVKVYTAYSSQHPAMPWTNKAQEEATGSGFSIRHDGALCIVTNAHVVADATYVEVRKAGDARKYVATRLKVAHECDLATLQVEDARFWEGVTPLKLGAMPSLQDEVAVVGYPEGGEGVSITQGVVSRIEIQRYAHSGTSLLAVQIDAAINPGNSGGPALNAKGEVVGVAFQLQQESQNIGYVIPVPTIQHFLADAVQGDPSRCAGFCSLGIFWQACMCTACALHAHTACALHVHCMCTAPRSRGWTSSLWQSLENQQLRDVHQLGARSGVLIRGAPHVPRMRSTSCVSCALHVHCICTAHLRRDLAAISLRSPMYTCTACIVCAPHAHRMHHCQAPLLHSTLALALALTLSP